MAPAPTSEPQWYRWCGEDLEITLRVQPRASQNCFVEEQGGSFRVRIQAAPVEGKANDGLRRFIADAFGVAQSRVEFLSGEQCRLKRLLIRSPRRFPVPIEPPVAPSSARLTARAPAPGATSTLKRRR